jgi:mechanosensitive ion channel-like protein
MDIGESVQRSSDKFFEFLPDLVGCLVLLLVGIVVAKILQGVVKTLLRKLGVDERMRASDGHRYVESVLPGSSVSSGIARIVFWLVFVFFLFAAIAALGISSLTDFMNDVLRYLPNVIVAVLIFVIAALVAGAVTTAVRRFWGDSPTGRVVSTAGPALVMVIALFMILDQLKIAEDIVTIAFAATMGALALGLALAFGLGGRGVAERMLEEAYRSGRATRDETRRDVHRGQGGVAEADTSGTGVGSAVASSPTTTFEEPIPGTAGRSQF